MWIRFLLVTILILTISQQSLCKRNKKDVDTKSIPKTQNKQSTVKSSPPKQKKIQVKQEDTPLWKFSLSWPGGECVRQKCDKQFLKNWDHQSFVIDGLKTDTQLNGKSKQTLNLNLTAFKQEEYKNLREDLKNFFPPNSNVFSKQEFSPLKWNIQWKLNGNSFISLYEKSKLNLPKAQFVYFQESINLYKGFKGFNKIYSKGSIKSQKDLTKLFGIQQTSYTALCHKEGKKNYLYEVQICLSFNSKLQIFKTDKCNLKNVKNLCTFPLTLSDYDQKWTTKQNWKNSSLVTNYLEDKQYSLNSAFKNVQEKVIETKATPSLKLKSIKTQEKSKSAKKQTNPKPKANSKQSKPKKVIFKSKEVNGRISFDWIFGQCYNLHLNGETNQCDWSSVENWDQHSFVIGGLITNPSKANCKCKAMKNLRKNEAKNQFQINNVICQKLKNKLEEYWPQDIQDNINAWQNQWSQEGFNFILTLNEILPYSYPIPNNTSDVIDSKLFQKQYFYTVSQLYQSFKNLQKTSKRSYTLKQLAKLIGVKSNSLSVECAHNKQKKTNLITSVEVCINLYSKDNSTIITKVVECKKEAKLKGCKQQKNENLQLLFWRQSALNESIYKDKEPSIVPQSCQIKTLSNDTTETSEQTKDDNDVQSENKSPESQKDKQEEQKIEIIAASTEQKTETIKKTEQTQNSDTTIQSQQIKANETETQSQSDEPTPIEDTQSAELSGNVEETNTSSEQQKVVTVDQPIQEEKRQIQEKTQTPEKLEQESSGNDQTDQLIESGKTVNIQVKA